MVINFPNTWGVKKTWSSDVEVLHSTNTSFYQFYDSCNDYIGLLAIHNCSKERLKNLLSAYRDANPDDYNWDDWLDFLEERGIKYVNCSPDDHIYF